MKMKFMYFGIELQNNNLFVSKVYLIRMKLVQLVWKTVLHRDLNIILYCRIVLASFWLVIDDSYSYWFYSIYHYH